MARAASCLRHSVSSEFGHYAAVRPNSHREGRGKCEQQNGKVRFTRLTYVESESAQLTTGMGITGSKMAGTETGEPDKLREM